MENSKILAATGHRPNKLGGYSPEAFERLRRVATEYLVEAKPEKIISGMALGWDTAWAVAGQSLGIPVIAAVPFFGQESMWPKESQTKYLHILDRCHDVIYVCDKGYAPWKMQIRNEYMVDKCDTLIALWDGSSGGTGNCIAYAIKVNKPIVNLWENFETSIS